jgi:uncharacterized repeat protein (TIGR03803 family)
MTKTPANELFALAFMQSRKRAVGKFGLARAVPVVLAFCLAVAVAAPAQAFTVLASLNGKDGGVGEGLLTQGVDGNYYAVAGAGGTNGNYGTVFRVTPDGVVTALHDFDVTDGDEPAWGMVQGLDGNFYGTTYVGGLELLCCGTAFKITPDGSFTSLHTFCTQSTCLDGAMPGRLVQADDRNFYGTTQSGGTRGGGTIFRMTSDGALTTLYNFCNGTGCGAGAVPSPGLMQGSDRQLYGATQTGVVFKMTLEGYLTVLYRLSTSHGDGFQPCGPVEGRDGNFYGTTAFGGTSGNGTVYKITPVGQETNLYNFTGHHGSYPNCFLMQPTDGNFYGTTEGGAGYDSTIFKITPNGAFTELYVFFSNGLGGGNSVIQATDGKLYGVSAYGLAHGDGGVFIVDLGLDPFVETRPTSGPVGTAITILGNNLTGTTSVSLGGIAAAFTVISNSEIITTVPVGATSGTVKVTTPGGLLTGNTKFRVTW